MIERGDAPTPPLIVKMGQLVLQNPIGCLSYLVQLECHVLKVSSKDYPR